MEVSHTPTVMASRRAAILGAVPTLCARGLPILSCDGKRPIHEGWQKPHPADLVKLIRQQILRTRDPAEADRLLMLGVDILKRRQADRAPLAGRGRR